MGRGVLDCSRLKRGEELIEANDPLVQTFYDMGLTYNDVRYYSGFVAYGCENLLLEGITLLDAPFWTVITRNDCRNVRIENIKILGQWRYNSDGIDLCTTKNAVVNDCFVRAFDDCVVICGVHLDGEEGGCENNVVTNNVLWCDWGKSLEIWSGRKDSFVRGVRFENNHLIRVCHHAISIDTWYGASDICVRGVSYRNIYIDTSTPFMLPKYQNGDDMKYENPKPNVPNAVLITVGKFGDGADDPKTDTYCIRYRDIHFENVVCRGNVKLPIRINATHLKDFGDVSFENCDFGGIKII